MQERCKRYKSMMIDVIPFLQVLSANVMNHKGKELTRRFHIHHFVYILAVHLNGLVIGLA